MTKRVWICMVTTAVLATGIAFWAVNSGAQPLRSEHARPAVTTVEAMVSVSADGNLFHAATCKDLHHPAETMSASAAIAKGYAPCTRCMRRAVGK